MEITAVKYTANGGYLVNGMSIPNAVDNRHYKMVQEWLAETHTVGTPASEDYIAQVGLPASEDYDPLANPIVGTPASEDYEAQVGLPASEDYDNAVPNTVEPFETAEEIVLREDVEHNATIVVELAELDTQSIRDIREWIASQADAPQALKDREAQAVNARANLR